MASKQRDNVEWLEALLWDMFLNRANRAVEAWDYSCYDGAFVDVERGVTYGERRLSEIPDTELGTIQSVLQNVIHAAGALVYRRADKRDVSTDAVRESAFRQGLQKGKESHVLVGFSGGFPRRALEKGQSIMRASRLRLAYLQGYIEGLWMCFREIDAAEMQSVREVLQEVADELRDEVTDGGT